MFTRVLFVLDLQYRQVILLFSAHLSSVSADSTVFMKGYMLCGHKPKHAVIYRRWITEAWPLCTVRYGPDNSGLQTSNVEAHRVIDVVDNIVSFQRMHRHV